MSNIVYQNSFVKVEIEPFEIPWIKVFTKEPLKEFSDCSRELKMEILDILDFIEKDMLAYFQPDKINIASFGNYVPHVHFHIQARFKDDSFFPEPTWGKKQRESNIKRDLDQYYSDLKKKLEKDYR
jgi:diadenosine tetraphosphate (Ap4A) HIT family hydrolase